MVDDNPEGRRQLAELLIWVPDELPNEDREDSEDPDQKPETEEG